MNRSRRSLQGALSALLILAYASSAVAQDQPLPPEPAPPPPQEPAPPPKAAPPAAAAPAAKPRPKPRAKPAPSPPAAQQPPTEPTAAPAEEEPGAAPAEPPADPAPAAEPPAPTEPAAPAAAGAHDDDRAEPPRAREATEIEPATPTRRPAPVPSPDATEATAEASVLVTYGPRVLDYEDGDTIPDGYVKDRRMRTGLVVGGAVTLGLAWLASCGAAGYFIWNKRKERDPVVEDFNDVPGEAALAIPLAGPFVALDTVSPNQAGAALLVADGVIQLGALAMLVTGLAAKETVLVRTESTEMALLPGAGPGGGGMSLNGTF